MNTLLPVSPRQALPLIERANAGQLLGADYPLVFGDEAPGRVIAVGEQEADPQSACAILAREFVTPQGTVKVGLIGSVATDPAHQGKGLATRVLVEAEAALAVQGCHIAMLWANDPNFYYSRGYRPVGCEVDVVVPRAVASKLTRSSGVRELRASDADAIHALYLQHDSRVERSPEETQQLLAIPGMSTLVLERDGKVTGYACLGKGHDLADVIHEWGGSIEDVLALVRSHLDARFPADAAPTDNDRLFLMAPITAGTMVEHLVSLGCDASIGILGLGRVLDHAACAELMQACLGDAGTAEFHTTEAGPGVALACKEGQGFLNDDLILTVLFPAMGLDQEVEEFRKSFGLEQAKFPIDLFAWGLDSI